MERACFTFELWPGQEAEYQRRHDSIWPEMADAVRNAGMRNYTLFRRGLTVFAYVECHPDVATALHRISASEVNVRWARWFEDVIQALTDESGQLRFAQEVWHLD